MTSIGGQYFLMTFDIIAFFILLLLGFSKMISLKWKKILLITLVYLLAMMIMLELGSFGPGLMYLVASGVFIALLFPSQDSWYGLLIGFIVCAFFGLQTNYHFIPGFTGERLDFMGWFAIAINLVFINGVIAKVVPVLFEKMQQSIDARHQVENMLLVKQAELNSIVQELEIKNANLNQLITGVSEDLQDPLRNIISFMENLKRKYVGKLDERAHQYIDFAIGGGHKMRDIILGLLEIAKIGKKREDSEYFHVDEIVQKVLLLQRKSIQNSNAKIEFGELPMIFAPKTYLLQVFNELISNSLKFCDPDNFPVVKISYQEADCWWQFAVKDNGIGFDSSDGKDPFTIFSKLHLSNEKQGFGIGLALVRKILENLQGSVWAESTPGQGSVFYLKIPKAA